MKKSFVLEKITENRKNNIANMHIGMIIKKKRLEKKMTLEETTKGICCVSYLSKLEHGIIEPKRYVMEEVLERLDVKKTALRSAIEYDKLLLECIKAFRDENREKMEEIYGSLSDDDDIHFADILRISYLIFTKEYQIALKLIEKTLSVKEHLDNQELITIILLIAIYNYENHEYAESLDCCLLLDDYYISDLNTNLLRIRMIIENKYVLGEYSTINDYIYSYQIHCLKAGDNKGIVRSHYIYSMAIALEGQRYEAFKVYNNIVESLKEETQISWKKDLLIALNCPTEVLEFELTPIEKIWAYDMLEQGEEVINILDMVDKSNLSILEEIFVQTMCKKYIEGEHYFISYLKKTAFVYMVDHGMYMHAKYYGQMLIRELSKNSRYKDAVQVYEKIDELHNIRWKI